MILLFLNIGGGEILIMLLVMLLIFGHEQAIYVARKTGKILNDFKRASQSIKDELLKKEEEMPIKTSVFHPVKEMLNKMETIDADYEVAEQKSNKGRNETKKTEQTTTI